MTHDSALHLLSALPARSVGAIITDPPIAPDDAAQTAAQAGRALRLGGALVLLGASPAMSEWDLVVRRSGLVWMAEMAVLWNTGKTRMRNFDSLFTLARWYIRAGRRHTFHFDDQRSVFSNVLVCHKVPMAERHHASQKPVELTNFLVSLLTDEDDTVVDPYCGSGSTLVSAALCGRRWIGADTDPDYCEIANRRAQRWELEVDGLRSLRLWVDGREYEVSQ